MSTLALWPADAASLATQTKSKPSFFERLLAARERKAMRRIHTFLITKSDERLKDLGYTAEDIAALRDGKTKKPR